MRSGFLFRPARFLVYALVTAVVYLLVHLNGLECYPKSLQFLLLFRTSCIALWIYTQNQRYRHTSLLFLGFSVVSLLQELDVYTRKYIGMGTWQFEVYFTIGPILYLSYVNRKALLEELKAFVKTLAFIWFSIGVLLAYVMPLLTGLQPGTAEESMLKLYGYLFLLFAAMEMLMLLLRDHAASQFNEKQKIRSNYIY